MYYIKINISANVVNIYKKDNQNNYTIPYKVMICSVGENTPKKGIYEIDYKYRWLALVGNVYGQYCTRIVGNILFHSVPYKTNKDPGSLKSEEYDKLGEIASAGCVRLKVEDAKWIYDNINKKTKVEFYEDQNPGPLGKPELFKISNYDEPYKNWDPTDPDFNNPWINFEE
jgi:lipoprotein-anchoring transpeptidase ErfK/SrfK